jgi:hypothetical protein
MNQIRKEDELDGPDQCNFYLVTIVLDTTIGVYISCNILAFIESIL